MFFQNWNAGACPAPPDGEEADISSVPLGLDLLLEDRELRRVLLLQVVEVVNVGAHAMLALVLLEVPRCLCNRPFVHRMRLMNVHSLCADGISFDIRSMAEDLMSFHYVLDEFPLCADYISFDIRAWL